MGPDGTDRHGPGKLPCQAIRTGIGTGNPVFRKETFYTMTPE